MPEVEIKIGDRAFVVACEAGEERHLHNAAELLNMEATALRESVGRVPESRMLLMAGLMLSDKTIGMGWQIEELKDRVKSLEQRLESADARSDDLAAGQRLGGKVDGEAELSMQLLDLVATEMESLANDLEAKAA